MVEEPMNAERLAKVYVRIREKRRELAKQDKELEEQLELIAAQLLEICKEQGASTIRTTHGTISRRTTKRFWPTDWEAFYNFIKDNDAFSLLQQRVHTAHMEQFLEENPDLHPPGLNVDATQTVVIVKR
jgi:hypothetical protein